MERKDFDWKPKYAKEMMQEASKIKDEDMRIAMSAYVGRGLADEIASEYNKYTDKKDFERTYTEMCGKYPLIKKEISMIVDLLDGNITQYVFLLLNNIIAEVEEYAREMAYDDAYEDTANEADEKLKKENENLREIITNQMYKTMKLEEKANEIEEFLDFIKEEIPDVYTKLKREFKKRKEFAE